MVCRSPTVVLRAILQVDARHSKYIHPFLTKSEWGAHLSVLYWRIQPCSPLVGLDPKEQRQKTFQMAHGQHITVLRLQFGALLLIAAPLNSITFNE
jgi:hypothetical protein